MQEELKTFPFGDVWTKYCEECGVPADKNWFAEVERYEKEVLLNRQPEQANVKNKAVRSDAKMTIENLNGGKKT